MTRHLKSNVVYLIKRSLHGQVYLVNGLGIVCHFASGALGIKVLRDIFDVRVVNGYEPIESYPIRDLPLEIRYCVSVSGRRKKSKSQAPTHVSKVMKICNDIGENLLPTLLSKPKRDSDRIDISINFGMTDQKCHCYESWTIFGNIKPDLITGSIKLVSNKILDDLGRLCMFFSDNIVPYHHLESAFPVDTILDGFAKQLRVSENEINRFRVPALSIILPSLNLLRPHCDTLNARESTNDFTYQVMVPIKVSSLSGDVQNHIKKAYGKKNNIELLPITFLFYTRRCVKVYNTRKSNIEDFVSKPNGGRETVGRRLLSEIFTDMGRSYHQRVMNESGYQTISDSCQPVKKEYYYAGNGTEIEELCDKMVRSLHFICKIFFYFIEI